MLVEVMTEKAAVEVPAPVSGEIVSTTGQPGDMVPVGAELMVLETGSAGAAAGTPAQPASTAGNGGGGTVASRPAPETSSNSQQRRGAARPAVSGARSEPACVDLACHSPPGARGGNRSAAGRGIGAERAHRAEGLRSVRGRAVARAAASAAAVTSLSAARAPAPAQRPRAARRRSRSSGCGA